jgi:orotate phosphoribosyltransferase
MLTTEEVIAILTGILSAAQAIKVAGGNPLQVVAIVDEHPSVNEARARVQAALDAKFPLAAGVQP